MALDAQTQRMLGNVHDRNMATALTTARQIHDRAARIVADLGVGIIPGESVSELVARLDMLVAGLVTHHELAEIIKADGT